MHAWSSVSLSLFRPFLLVYIRFIIVVIDAYFGAADQEDIGWFMLDFEEDLLGGMDGAWYD